jgi:hypothetical protein
LQTSNLTHGMRSQRFGRLRDPAMPAQQRRSFALKAAGWISTPFLYALMVGIVIRAARQRPARHT